MRLELKNLWEKFTPYAGCFCFAVSLVLIYAWLVPCRYFTEGENLRAIIMAFGFGALVGLTEIASRYRDEQMKAILSPDGVLYVLFNGAISTFALILILHYRSHPSFSLFKDNTLGAVIAAGFGATALMRTRLAVLKGPDNKEISIGPDIVITMLLSLIDKRIDRWRARQRVQIVFDNLKKIAALGPVDEASAYLLSSLLAFQNLDASEKKQLTDIIASNKADKMPVKLQLEAMGFLFLTVVGEDNFESLLKRAQELRDMELLPENKETPDEPVAPPQADLPVPPPPDVPPPAPPEGI